MSNNENFTFNQESAHPDLWVIHSIKNHNGADKTDGRHPFRIGCTVAIIFVGISKPLIWSYVADSSGGVKQGYFVSSELRCIYYERDEEALHAETQNSVYVLKKLPQKWGEIYGDREIVMPDWFPAQLGAIEYTVPCKTPEWTNKPLIHICEVCGREEIMDSGTAYSQGWDYPPIMGTFKTVSARTCSSCPIDKTLWWALAINKIPPDMLEEKHKDTLYRILNEPEIIMPGNSENLQ